MLLAVLLLCAAFSSVCFRGLRIPVVFLALCAPLLGGVWTLLALAPALLLVAIEMLRAFSRLRAQHS